MVNRLRLQPLARSQDTLWLEFAALFEVPSATADYLWLCRHFTCLAISAIPSLDQRSLDVQQRFLNFVDIAYDSGVQLLLASAVNLDQLCVARAHADFARTRSRLAQLRPLAAADNRECQAC
ncbi:Cell division protein ZapE [compost metagenome]